MKPIIFSVLIAMCRVIILFLVRHHATRFPAANNRVYEVTVSYNFLTIA